MARAFGGRWQESLHSRSANGRFAQKGSGRPAPPASSRQYKRVDRADNDRGVQDALGRYGGDGQDVYVAETARAAGVQSVAAAWTDADGNIFVNNQSRAYISAKKGDTTELAAALAHEQFHRENKGAGEGPAYDHQLAVLRKLGAKKSLVNEIEEAKRRVTRTEGSR